MRWWIVAAVGAWCWLVAAPAAARGSEPRVDDVRVWLTVYRGGELRPDGRRVNRRGAEVDGVVEYVLDRPAEAGDTIVLLDFAEFMHDEPIQLDEVALATYVAGPFQRGSLEITGQWGATEVEREGPRRDIRVHVREGVRVVTLRYRVVVPHRYWPFGCVRRRCSLSGALAPLPSEPADGGRWLPPGRVVVPSRWTVERAELATPGSSAPTGVPRERGRPDQVFVVGGRGELTGYPSVFFGPRWHRLVHDHRGVRIDVHHMYTRPENEAPDEKAIQLRRDVAGETVEIAGELVDLLAEIGRPLPVGEDIAVVQGPLRSTVAEFHPGVVIVSDQAMQLFPFKRFLKFHQEAIARSVLDMSVERMLRGRHDASTDLWLEGAAAFALLQVWRQRESHRDEYAAELLHNFTFMPAVDRFLYTQQASFSQTYFRGVDDHPYLRNHPLWFANELPTGRRLHEKLTDTLGAARLDRFYTRMFADLGRDPQVEASRAYGRTLGWFFDQWLGPYPSVDYIVADVRSTRREGGWHHVIAIDKQGKRPVIEPVQVLVTEKGGGPDHYLVWNGQLADEGDLAREPRQGRHVFELDTNNEIATVRLDPRNRLVETAQPPHDNVDPRFNDRRPPRFRFLYTGAGLSIAASEFVDAKTPATRFNAVAGFISFESSLRRDLRRTGYVFLSRDREDVAALGLGTNFWFGAKKNKLRRRSRVELFQTSSLVSARSLDPHPGMRFSERIALVDDTRKFLWWPERGRRLSVGFMARQVLGIQPGVTDVYDLEVDADWVHLWRIAHDHVIATLIRGEVVIPLRGGTQFRELTRVGGIGGLSGYLADEVFGLGLVTAQAEYRHVYLDDMRLNALHLGFLRSIGGVLYGGTATASDCQDFGGWFGKNSWYGHVGYGLMAYFQVLGVTPQLLRLDASFPLVRRTDRTCLGHVFPDYLGQYQGRATAAGILPAFNLNLVFQQTF